MRTPKSIGTPATGSRVKFCLENGGDPNGIPVDPRKAIELVKENRDGLEVDLKNYGLEIERPERKRLKVV